MAWLHNSAMDYEPLILSEINAALVNMEYECPRSIQSTTQTHTLSLQKKPYIEMQKQQNSWHLTASNIVVTYMFTSLRSMRVRSYLEMTKCSCDSYFVKINPHSLLDWLIGCFGFNGAFRQYISLHQIVSKKEVKRKKK